MRLTFDAYLFRKNAENYMRHIVESIGLLSAEEGWAPRFSLSAFCGAQGEESTLRLFTSPDPDVVDCAECARLLKEVE